ncbi:MAG: RHS repeat-associated core domain-containing protein [Weeksellaceae bacterium]
MEYLPFGETLVEEHLNSYNIPFKFNGKELDEETGNYYYGARYYNPKTSIWLSVDPLAEQMPSWSSYNYTFSNPIKYTDPTGMATETGEWPPKWLSNLINYFGLGTGTDKMTNALNHTDYSDEDISSRNNQRLTEGVAELNYEVNQIPEKVKEVLTPDAIELNIQGSVPTNLMLPG